MPVLAPPVPCPGCGAPLRRPPGSCPGCGLPLTGPLAGRLAQIDRELGRLAAERADVVAALRAGGAPVRSRRSGQQLLLGLGVALLLVAAAVFLAVAWSWLGVLGQVGVMAAATAGALAAAVQLCRRGLGATAESVSVLAVGLTGLDAVAARALGLAGLDRVDALAYAAAGGLLVAAVAAAGSAAESRLRLLPLAGVVAAGLAALLAVAAAEPGPALAPWLLLLAASALSLLAVALRAVRPAAAALAAVVAAGAALLGAAAGLVAAADGLQLAGSAAVLAVVAAAAAGERRAPTALLRTAAGSVAAGLLALLLVVDVQPAGARALVLLGAVAAGAVVTAAALRRPGRARSAVLATGLTTCALVVLAVQDAPHAERSTALALLAAGAVAAAATARRSRELLCGGAALLVLLAVASAVEPAPLPARAGALLLTALLGAALVAARPGREEPVAAVAVLAAAAAVATAVDGPALLLAGVLAACGAAALAVAALPGRGAAALPGVLSCSAASWVLLGDAGVDLVEAYSLPLAALLLAVGLVRLQRDPDAPSWATVGPAASAALLPSAAVAAGQPGFLRAGLVLVAGAAVLLAGVARRWQAPTVSGTVAVVLVAGSQLAPYAVGAPRWLTLGSVGLALLAVGARYEQRRADLQQSARWVAGLR